MDKEKEITLDMVMQNQRRIENKLDTLYEMIDEILSFTIEFDIKRKEEKIENIENELKHERDVVEFRKSQKYRIIEAHREDYYKEVQ